MNNINYNMTVGEVEINLNAETGNRQFVQNYYKTVTRTGVNVRELPLFNINDNQMKNPILFDAYNFFKSNRCVYAFVTMLWIKDIIRVYDSKIYMYQEEFNYWQIQRGSSEEFLLKIKEFLEKTYQIQFKYLEMLGISMNSKIRTVIKDLKVDRRFNIDDIEFQKLIYQSSDWINFKNCCYNIETGDVITDNKKRRDLFFDTYIDANYIDEELDLSNKNLRYFLEYYETSLNFNSSKLFQLGQHLIYSICTKTPRRKAKQILFMIGGHDVGKSCLIDLFSSYIPVELISHISPTKFGSDGAKAKILNVRLNTTHEIPANRTLPISEFNKTVWINFEEVVIGEKIFFGNYMQLHQVYAANNFFKIKSEYDPKDYLPKINLLIIDGSPQRKISDLSQLLICERDYIISFFLNLRTKRLEKGSLYQELKYNNFEFIELEDAIDYKLDLEAEYQEEILAKNQKLTKKTDYSILDYGLSEFIEEKIQFIEIEKIDKKISVGKFIKEYLKITEHGGYRIYLKDLYKYYVNYCNERNIEYFNNESLFKKRLAFYWKDKLIIESKLNGGKSIIEYEETYKKMLLNQDEIVVYKKYGKKGKSEMGYLGIRVL